MEIASAPILLRLRDFVTQDASILLSEKKNEIKAKTIRQHPHDNNEKKNMRIQAANETERWRLQNEEPNGRLFNG